MRQAIWTDKTQSAHEQGNRLAGRLRCAGIAPWLAGLYISLSFGLSWPRTLIALRAHCDKGHLLQVGIVPFGVWLSFGGLDLLKNGF